MAFALECVKRCVKAFGSVMASMAALAVILEVVVAVIMFVVEVSMVVVVLKIGDSASVGVLEARRCRCARGRLGGRSGQGGVD